MRWRRKLRLNGCDVLYAPLDFWPVMRRAFRVNCATTNRSDRSGSVAKSGSRGEKTGNSRDAGECTPVTALGTKIPSLQVFVTPIFRQLDLVCVPATEDAEQWKNLGVKTAANSRGWQHQIRCFQSATFVRGDVQRLSKPQLRQRVQFFSAAAPIGAKKKS